VDDVGAAILLPQPIVDRRGVEQKHAARFRRIGGFEQSIGGQIGDDKRDALTGQCRHRRGWIVIGLETHIDQREALIEEASGGVVILRRHLGARQPIVGRRHLRQRDRLRMRGAPQIADLDIERLRGSGGCNAKNDDEGADWEPDHGSLPINGAPTFPHFLFW
jgi:hypothetical protein